MPRAADLLRGNPFDLLHVLQFLDGWGVLPGFALLDFGADAVMRHVIAYQTFLEQVLQMSFMFTDQCLQLSNFALSLTD
jgi:hypothetical protein